MEHGAGGLHLHHRYHHPLPPFTTMAATMTTYTNYTMCRSLDHWGKRKRINGNHHGAVSVAVQVSFISSMMLPYSFPQSGSAMWTARCHAYPSPNRPKLCISGVD